MVAVASGTVGMPAEEARGSWPRVSYEEVAWDVHPVTGMTRQDRSLIGRPYRAAVVPPIAGVSEVPVPGPVAAEAEEAAAVIGAFDAELGAEIAPFSAILLRTESAASSQIEQLSASARKIAEAEVNGVGSAHAELIVANTHAMRAAIDLADQLTEGTVLLMHDVLMRASAPDIAGRWRADQVWIGGPRRFGGGGPHLADFVPPVAERVPSGIDDLMVFARRDNLPVLPQAAVAHAHFETIHPFPDGNGRTGRALLQAMLRAKRLTRRTSVPISAGLLTDTASYFDALTAYREGDPAPIVSSISRAALVGVENGRRLVADLRQVRARWDEQLQGVRADSGARRLMPGLIEHPVINASLARQILGSANEHRHIDVLIARGILVPHQDYKTRNMTWRAPDVLEALDQFAARAAAYGQ